MAWSAWPLRGKLIAACLLVELAAGGLLVLAGARLLQHTLADQASHEARQVIAVLEQAVVAPLAQRDYATLQQTLDLVRSDAAIRYLVLWDHRERRVASSGWDAETALPPRDEGAIDLDRADATHHLRVPVVVSGQKLGNFDVGLSTDRLRQTRNDFLRHSLAIATAALVLSGLALAAIAYAITRHLARLGRASQRVAAGDFDVQVPVTTRDEIGHLALSFNAMAHALKDRIAALEHSEARQRLHLSEARDEQGRLTTLLEVMRDGILFVDGDARILYANASFARIWSMPGQLTGRPLAEVVPLLASQIEATDAPHIEAMLLPPASQGVGTREIRLRDGRTVTQRMQPVSQGSAGNGSIWFHDDVTLERRTQQRAHQAMHDPLTGLFNRRGLYESLQTCIAGAAARAEPVSLIYVDLDDFKHANDQGGHRTGDEILKAVSQALAAQMRRAEIVARLGGDEFAVLCPGAALREAGAIAARLVEAIAALRFHARGQVLRVGCSIGVATFPDHARTEDDLIACADAAMYEAKRSGKNGWAAYRDDPERAQIEAARIDWNARIHRALQEHRFVLHFQPVCRASDLQVVHHEALVRMVDEQDPSRLIAPGEFIAHAERSGKIRQIDRWVFEACCRQLAASADASVALAANLSARSLEDSEFADFLSGALQQHDVDPRRLHIELTETSAITDPVAARRMIDGLRRLGCTVHLDDFGSGFSSFAHLKLLDVEAIKIDGSFIRTLQSDASNRLFVAAMIDIAHSLGKKVVAEHVEDAQTLDVLREQGADLVQGFHLGRPSERLHAPRSRPHLLVLPSVRQGQSGGIG